MEENTNPVRKRKTPRHMSNIDLRPCEVCGGKSSGFHFGAITCEACKSFFRRTIKSAITYSCFRQESNEPCVIRLVKGGIAPCPACRWKRCQELNMSADAVKKGRYTHSKKAEAITISEKYWKSKSSTQNNAGRSKITENLSPEQPSSTTSPGSLSPSGSSATSPASLPESGSGSSIASATSASPSASSGLTPVSSDDGIQDMNFEFNITDVLQEMQEETDAPSFDVPSRTMGFPIKRIQATKIEADTTVQMQNPCCDIAVTLLLDSSAPEIEKELAIGAQSVSSLTLDIFDQDVADDETHLSKITEAVMMAYDRQNFLTKGFLSKVCSMQYQHMKEKEMNKELFGDLKTLAVEEHKTFMEETGIDIDGRVESLQKFLNSLEPTVRKFISLTQGIPGFRSLSPEDQVSMIKRTNIVMMETIYFPCHNIESGVIANPFRTGLRCIDHKLKSALIGQERVDIMRPIIKQLQDLELTDQENALLTSICIMHPDACVTDEGKIMCASIHNKLCLAMKMLLLRRLPEDESEGILQVVEGDIRQRLHQFGVLHFSRQWRRVVDLFGQSLRVPPLVMEWFNID